jgi:hypothetical protein
LPDLQCIGPEQVRQPQPDQRDERVCHDHHDPSVPSIDQRADKR